MIPILNFLGRRNCSSISSAAITTATAAAAVVAAVAVAVAVLNLCYSATVVAEGDSMMNVTRVLSAP